MGKLNGFERYDPPNNMFGSISNKCTPEKSATGEY